MWDEQFRLSEAAEVIGIPFALLKGWRQRGLIAMAGRDRTRPGHPHCVSLAEVVRLRIAAQIQRLSRAAFRTHWNPGPFLRALRKSVPDREFRQIPVGSSPVDGAEPALGNGTFLSEEDVRSADRAEDMLLIIVSAVDESSTKEKSVRLIPLERFRKEMNAYPLGDNTYLLVNVSGVLRRILARCDEIRDRREKVGAQWASDGWRLPVGFRSKRRG